MNVESIQSLARDLTNTDSTSLTDAKLLTWLNISYGHRILDILKLSVDKNATINEAKTDLISTVGLSEGDNGYNGEYAFPSDLLRPVRVEISYDGTTSYPCEIYDVAQNLDSEYKQTDINNSFSQDKPFVRFDRNSYFIRPLKATSGNITNGIHIWYEKRQADLTTGSPTFESSLHDILAYDIAEMEYLRHSDNYTNSQYTRFRIKHADVQRKFEEFYKNRFKRTFNLNSRGESYN